MRPHNKAAILVLLTAFIGILVYHGVRSAEPSYQGKALSSWIRGLEYLNHNPTDEQRAALRSMGEPAVTRLISILQRRDSALKQKFLAYASHHAYFHNYFNNPFLTPRYVIPESVYHAQAATALGEIGPSAWSAIPALTAASTNQDFQVACRAKAALIKMRWDSVTPMLAALEDPRSANWAQACWTTKYLGTNGETAAPLLVSALQSTNVGVRQLAAMALGGIASHPDISIPALINCLQDKNARIRSIAIDALCKFKGAKPQIVPLLLDHMKETDNNTWLSAAYGLDDLLTSDEKRTLFVPALIDSLNNQDAVIRANAAIFLKRVAPESAAKAGVK